MGECPICGKDDCRSVKCLVALRHPKKEKADPRAVHRKYSHTEKGMETRREVTKRRRAREKTVNAGYSREEWENACEYFGRKCAYCGDGKSLHKDHFYPLFDGGETTKKNLVPSCRKCNTSKKNLDPLEWLLSREHGLVTYAKVREYLDKA